MRFTHDTAIDVALRGRAPRILACLTLLLSLASCAPAPPPPIRVATNPWPGYEFLFLADKKGFFRDAGITVQFVETMSLADARRAFERGQVDVFAGTAVELLMSRELSDRKAQAVYVCDYSAGADVILARPPLASVPALKGRRIGLEPATVNVVLLNAALHKHNLHLEDVTIVPLAQNAMPAALARGDVDAVVSYPPVSVALQAGSMNLVFDSSRTPGEIVDVIAADAEFLRARRGDMAAFVRAFGKAQQYAARCPDEAHDIMARRERLSVEEIRGALRGMRLVTFPEQAAVLAPDGSLATALRTTMEGLHGAGLAENGSVPPDMIWQNFPKDSVP